jgi:hypothetical protein
MTRMPPADEPERPSSEADARGPLRPAGSDPPSADSSRDVANEDFLFHLYRGSELLQENRVHEAKEELEYALTLQPLDPKGQDLLAAVYFRLGLYPRAIRIYESLIGQFPRDASVKVNLGLGLLKTGQPDRARIVFEQALLLSPHHKRAWGYLGLVLQKLGDVEQAQIAFERGGHPTMAKRVTQARLRSLMPPSRAIDPGLQKVFRELDASDLRFSVAPPEAPLQAGEGAWQLLEIGNRTGEGPPEARPVPFVAPRQPPLVALAPVSTADAVFAHTHLVPPPLTHSEEAAPEGPRAAPPVQEQFEQRSPKPGTPLGVPSLLPAVDALGPLSLAPNASGVLVARAGRDAARAFAARLDAVRLISGSASPQNLRKRTRDGDTAEMLGGIDSPLVRFEGEAHVVLGPRIREAAITLLRMTDDLVFVREECLLGFELTLLYENGKLALDTPAEAGGSNGSHGATSSIVQFRGTGAVALEVASPVATVASTPGRALLVRPEWVVGWVGRLMPRPLGPAEAPNGQRGFVSFSGEGAVLVRA